MKKGEVRPDLELPSGEVLHVRLPAHTRVLTPQIVYGWFDLLADFLFHAFGEDLLVVFWVKGEDRLVLKLKLPSAEEIADEAVRRFRDVLEKQGAVKPKRVLDVLLNGKAYTAAGAQERPVNIGEVAAALSISDNLLGYVGIYKAGTIERPPALKGKDFLSTPADIIQALRFLWELVAGERERLDAIIHAMIDGVMLINEEGHILFANRTAREFLGLQRRHCFSLQSLSEAKYLDISGLLQEARSNNMGTLNRIQKVEERKQILGVHIQKLKNSYGNDLGWMVILRDITADWEMDRLRKEFIAKITHELHSPLTVVSEGIALVLEGQAGPVSEDQKRCLTYAQENVARMGRLIDNLLKITRLEFRDAELERRRVVRLNVVVERIAASYERMIEAKDIRLRLNISKEPLDIRADRDQITQIFANLLDNALKYTLPGGQIEVGVQREGDWVKCWVKDTGIGIPEEEQKKIFEKFYRVEEVVNRRIRGHGLGLAISKEIVDKYGGKIWVESEPGEGSTFYFTLPLHRGRGVRVDGDR